ncbi:MAG: MBL fold metallo-hydrolase [Leptospiraceae bacterium]|nr:MBL fold metallo-hydrolase [Leptospiraceae bacterium]
MSDIQVTFRGVRGSHAMPGESTIRYGGNTTCLEVRAGGKLLVIDAGTGIISLGKELIKEHFASQKPMEVVLLLTHMHHDHNEGLPFFQPMYIASSRIYMFGPDPLEENISTVLFHSPYFPVELEELPSLKFLHSLMLSDMLYFENNEPRLIHSIHSPHPSTDDEVIVRIHRGKAHPKEGVFMYRVEYKGKSVAFCTDTEGYVGGDTGLIRFVDGVDLLIHDAQYSTDNYINDPVPKQGFGHSTPQMAMEVARRAGVGRLILTHHDPDASDDVLDSVETEVAVEYPGCQLAREGMQIHL